MQGLAYELLRTTCRAGLLIATWALTFWIWAACRDLRKVVSPGQLATAQCRQAQAELL